MSDSTSLPATLSVESADAPAAFAAKKRSVERALGIFVPILTVLALLILWQLLVVGTGIPQYILPSPIAVLSTRAVGEDFEARFSAKARNPS